MKKVKCMWYDMYPDLNFGSCPCADRNKEGFCKRAEHCKKYNLEYYKCPCMREIEDEEQITIFDLTNT